MKEKFFFWVFKKVPIYAEIFSKISYRTVWVGAVGFDNILVSILEFDF